MEQRKRDLSAAKKRRRGGKDEEEKRKETTEEIEPIPPQMKHRLNTANNDKK